MTPVVCRSAYIAAELSCLTGLGDIAVFQGGGSDSPSPLSWLSGVLAANAVSVVFYEPSFFVDPAPYRAISPGTRFVVLAGPGDENDAQKAMVFGASAVIGKPLRAQEVSGVLSLVSL